jgi:hypothetical protein
MPPAFSWLKWCMGDLATNMAQTGGYLVTGEMPEEALKGDETSFVAHWSRPPAHHRLSLWSMMRPHSVKYLFIISEAEGYRAIRGQW